RRRRRGSRGWRPAPPPPQLRRGPASAGPSLPPRRAPGRATGRAPAPGRRRRVRRSQIPWSSGGGLLERGRRGVAVVGGRRAVAAPFALFLQGLLDLTRHVLLVVLGQHLLGLENAVGAEGAGGHDTLPLAEQVRQVALLGD